MKPYPSRCPLCDRSGCDLQHYADAMSGRGALIPGLDEPDPKPEAPQLTDEQRAAFERVANANKAENAFRESFRRRRFR